ncbi:MAG: hypothetical protein HC877_23145 [Thioploca sp.]|nr:hypothetical protein [Thioploca sp.]
MFTYELAIYLSGQLIDNIRVSAINALDACNEVAGKYNHSSYEIVAKRVVDENTISYYTYFNDLVILNMEKYLGG